MPEDHLSNTEHAIWAAQPYALAETAVTAIEKTYGATTAELLLADYRLRFLVPVLSNRPIFHMDGTPSGRAFAAQEPVVRSPGEHGGWDVYLPLAVRGDRLGVLTASFPCEPDTATQRELMVVATVLARALKIADGDTDFFRSVRRRNRLTLAAEIQWDLLPGRSRVCEEYHLAAQLEPAYAIWGDNYDWSASADRLTVSVTNGMGRAVEAALLTQLAVSALRNARRSGADIVDQATLANETIHYQHQGQRHVSTLLLCFDLATGRVAAVDAGSPEIFRMRGGAVERLEMEAQLPLGMFEDTHYSTQEITIQPGDRLVIFSDGFHAARSPSGDIYGATTLVGALRQTRLQSPSEAVRTLIRGLLDYHEGGEIADDAVVLCLDWTGRPAGGARRQ